MNLTSPMNELKALEEQLQAQDAQLARAIEALNALDPASGLHVPDTWQQDFDDATEAAPSTLRSVPPVGFTIRA